jgi:hypothetical protein
MTTCDHGIRLDRFCGDCDAGFTFRESIDEPAWTAVAEGLAIIGVAVVIAIAVLAGRRWL